MNMPTFTAEASLYETSGHYRAGRCTIDSSAQPNSAVWPAMKDEQIEIHDCPVGFIKVGEWPNMACVLIPPGGGGGENGGIPPGGGPEDGGPTSTPPKPPQPKNPPPIGSVPCNPTHRGIDAFADKCLDKNKSGKRAQWQVFCGPEKGEKWCCFYDVKKGWINCELKPPPTTSQ